jgi:hypothetical protein
MRPCARNECRNESMLVTKKNGKQYYQRYCRDCIAGISSGRIVLSSSERREKSPSPMCNTAWCKQEAIKSTSRRGKVYYNALCRDCQYIKNQHGEITRGLYYDYTGDIRRVDQNGYVRVRTKEKNGLAGFWAQEHRVVREKDVTRRVSPPQERRKG